MARIIPPDYRTADTLHESERQTLEHLEEALPDSYAVFSSVLWARSHACNTRYGEIDFCVVSPAGQLVVIEQKAGGMTVRDGQLYKYYGSKEKDAGRQLLRSIAALKESWQRQHHGATVAIDYLLYLPHYRLQQTSGLCFDASRIVHAGSTRSLAQTLRHICNDAEDGDGLTPAPEQVAAMHGFLTGVLELELDIGRLQSHQERFYRRHQDSLLAWVDRLSFSPPVLRVDGCAGSGKTQLAAALLRQARNRGERVRCICFNRPLADSLADLLGEPDIVQNRDQFYGRFLQLAHGLKPDYSQADNDRFAQQEAQVAALPVPDDWLCDLLVIDEGQDMPQRSLDTLRRFLRPGGRLVWLEDSEQRLYDHAPVTLGETVTLRLDDCFRSPRLIVRYLNALLPLGRTLISANPHAGEEPVFHVVTPEQLHARLIERLDALLARGVSPRDIAILSLHGFKKSSLHQHDTLGSHHLSRFTGEYDPDGRQRWTQGEIVTDSIYRFKGSQRPFVLLIDADFTRIDTRATRLLYCGMTRATLGLELFLTPTCNEALMASVAAQGQAQ